MDFKLKNIGSPTSQGNVGAKYEDCVAAWCMARMVCEVELSQVTGLPVSVSLQAKHEAPKIDDVVVRVRLNGHEKDVFVQAKLTLSFVPSDGEFAETIQAIRDRITIGKPESEVYVIAFERNDNNNGKRIEKLFEYAGWAPNADEWIKRAELDAYVREALKTMRLILNEEGVDAPLQIIYRVCKQTRLWQLSFMNASARDREDTFLLLKRHVKGGYENARLFWNSLVSVVTQGAGVRGMISRQELIGLPGICSLYREPSIADPAANSISERWIEEQRQRAKALDEEVRSGRAYEALVETEDLLALVERIRLLHGDETPAGHGLRLLACELMLAQGRAWHVMNFQDEVPAWIQRAKELSPSPQLWMQMGRLAHFIKDRATILQAFENVRGVSDQMLLKIRLALLDGDEANAWKLVEAVPPEGQKEAFGVRAIYLFENLNDAPSRAKEALLWAKRHREILPERPMAVLLLASAVYVALALGASPLYSRGAASEQFEFGLEAQSVRTELIHLLDGSVGVYEKSVAFGLLLRILVAFREPTAPYVAVLEDFPAYLIRSTSFRALGYAQAMGTIGKFDLAKRALQQKVTLEPDPELKAELESAINSIGQTDPEVSGSVSEHPYYFRGRMYAEFYGGDIESAITLARRISADAPDDAISSETAFLVALNQGDPKLFELASGFVRDFPYALESYNGLIGWIDSRIKTQYDQASQSIKDFLESLEGQGQWKDVFGSLFVFCNQLLRLLPSHYGLGIWLNWAINLDNLDQVSQVANSARSWGLTHFSSLAEAWIAAAKGRFSDVEQLISKYGERYRVTGSIADFRDRSALQSGSTRILIDRRQELLGDKERLPGTAKYTVHALILEAMPHIAAETAKANLDDFPDDRTALRDFIFAALRLKRLDLAPDALQRFSSLFPDDKYLWTVNIEEGQGLTDLLPRQEDERQKAYNNVHLPLHLTGKPFPERWFQQIHRAEGLNVRRLGLYGTECEAVIEGMTAFLDITALLAASRYGLWGNLAGLRLRTSHAVVACLRAHTRAMKLQLNEVEVQKHVSYSKLLERPNIKVYDALPDHVRSTINKVEFTIGEEEVTLHRWLGLPYIATSSHRDTRTYRLQDLISTLHSRGLIRLSQRNDWLAKLKSVHQDVYETEPELIEGPIDCVLFDDTDLRDINEAGLADEFVPLFTEIVLGPVSSLAHSLLSSPHLWAEKAVRATTEYLGQVESAIENGRLEVIEELGLTESDEVEFLQQMARIAADSDFFWCDDTVCRSLIAHESGIPTASTHQVIRLLNSEGRITPEIYRDIITMIGADGHRDIDGDDLLITCAEDVGYNFTPELSRCAFKLGMNLRLDGARNDEEAEFIRRHAAFHLIAFVDAVPADKAETLYETCRSLAAGAGLIGGRIFWQRVWNDVSERLNGEKAENLSALERAAFEAGQLDMKAVIESEAARRQQSNQPQLVSAPSFHEYMRFLRYGQ